MKLGALHVVVASSHAVFDLLCQAADEASLYSRRSTYEQHQVCRALLQRLRMVFMFLQGGLQQVRAMPVYP